MSYNVVLSGFETKEQAEEFIRWYGGVGEQHFGDYLECRNSDVSFISVNYNKVPTWFGDNYVAHLDICYGEEDDYEE